MKKLLGNFLFFSILSLFIAPTALSQDSVPLVDDVYLNFKNQDQNAERFSYFFGAPNRYKQNSAYDWLDAVNQYLNEAIKQKDSIAIRDYMLMQSQVYYDLGDYDKSLAISSELYDIKEQLSLDFKAKLLGLMDQNYSQLALYAEQIDIRKEKKDLGLTDDIAFYDIYSNLGLHRKAMKDYIIEVRKTFPDDDEFSQAKYHNNIGNYLRLDNSPSVALNKYKEAKGHLTVYLNNITVVKTENELISANSLMGVIDGNIGKCYSQLGQYEVAIPFLESGIEQIMENSKGKYSDDIVENTLEIANCYLQLEDYEKAVEYLSSDVNLTKTEHILKRNRLLASYYDKTGDYQNSAAYLKRNMRIRDSIDINESELRTQQLATVMGRDLANTQAMFEEQKKSLEQQRLEMTAQDEKISLVFISLVFTLLGFAGLVYAYLKSIKNQRLIAEQKHIIENSLIEKDSLLKEIHHRVKNNLQMVSSLLSLQTKNTRSKAAIEALEEGKSRVKAMALIHQKLYQNDDLSVIEMQGYIESLINSVQSVYKKGGHNINITIDAEGVELDIDRAIPFGLILNELVSNSFKYAFPNDEENGKIYIHIRKVNGQEGFFEYTDNGVGLPEDTDIRAQSSMGIRLMNRLANQLQTSLNVDKVSEGVHFWFNFK
ncbi:tetratricopeptide repeat protein [Maribacter polysiphoniae]|uniref:histidine kinase n=1 Tax=Maribacter polysiphoniae TaxID=429344 RepID=A0A316E0X9_9FLAO|nr:histidine kinase dimerization/phosphoacceptor domain -containing protein [Maribacter polysiphoniae]MBD1261768.1 tetratricopeptide repeat protein [Maribacter polysiphoniae]PWK22423.1 two-component sensor histidine kinase [Maribacter polysiphoniae]